MAFYRVEFTNSAMKEFDRLPTKIQALALEALSLLSQNPYSELLNIKKLKGAEDLYRVRIGTYRVIYEVLNERLVVIVIKIGDRRDVYRGL